MKIRRRAGSRSIKRRLAAAAVLAVLLVLLLIFFRPEDLKQDKATWLWDASLIRHETEQILDFSREEGITTIFLQIQEEVRAEEYRRFIRTAGQYQIKVHALDGQPEWAYSEQREEGLKLLAWLEEYNFSARPEERFSGIQLDVEPYVLRRWEQEQESVVREWSGNMEEWSREARRQGLSFSAAVPFWLDSIPGPEGEANFCGWILEHTDAIAVMSYRDDGQKMYELSREELEMADKLGKSVWIGMEVASTEEGEHLTFHNKTGEEVKQEAKRAASLGAEHASFAGLAVHHYEAWHAKLTAMHRSEGQEKE